MPSTITPSWARLPSRIVAFAWARCRVRRRIVTVRTARASTSAMTTTTAAQRVRTV